ncbi:MAG: glutamate--tRNA ligase [Holosporaceae bacterium]|jgi:glutamyl-tRNA synthetase|nr:glutamate--tRNA ligase [Holosporaceae bacterium]
MVRVRFAPSPTGLLHVGNIRIAILNYLFAKKNRGSFVLRIDDTDKERSSKEYERMILEDLEWIGIQWDALHRQSENIVQYNEAIEELKKQGRVYPCYETKQELVLKKKIQISRGKSPVYDREALQLSKEERKEREARGIRPHWRFRLNETQSIRWRDLVHGDISIPLDSVSDPVLIKSDGTFVYMFASVVDDINMDITHIIRGDDHITNTAAQIDIFTALSGGYPKFAHVPLLLSFDGQDVSKRSESSLSIVNLRNAGADPLAIWQLLATLGTANDEHHSNDIKVLIDKFSFEKMSRSSPKFNPDDIMSLTKKIIATKSHKEAQQIIGKNISEEFWDVIRMNLHSLKEVTFWEEVFFGKITIIKEDETFLRQMIQTLQNPVDFHQWMQDLKQLSKKRGRDLFHPIRIALTGLEDGPELMKIVYLLGYDRVRSRLEENLRIRQ